MIIYNVTSKVDHAIAEAWLEWMKNEHIPDVLSTGCFSDARILQLLETDESDGLTYAVQYHAESKALYNRYIREYADALRKKTTEKWGERLIAFRSVMQIVH